MDPAMPAGSFRELAHALPPLSAEPPRAERSHRSLSIGAPSRAVLGGLPLARLIPQDVHSVMDYTNGLVAAAAAIRTGDPAARIASLVLAASAIGVAAVTDARTSIARRVPIETHEVADHAWGLAAIAAPFVLGYWRSAPRVALAHVIAGIGTIAASLVTDYRTYSRRTRRSQAPAG